MYAFEDYNIMDFSEYSVMDNSTPYPSPEDDTENPNKPVALPTAYQPQPRREGFGNKFLRNMAIASAILTAGGLGYGLFIASMWKSSSDGKRRSWAELRQEVDNTFTGFGSSRSRRRPSSEQFTGEGFKGVDPYGKRGYPGKTIDTTAKRVD